MLKPKVMLKFTRNWIMDRWILVAYKIINWNIHELVEGVELKDDEHFYQVVEEFTTSYIHDDVMPPKEIAPAILNIADDYVAGRDITLRAGDYIAIKNYLRTREG